MLLHIAMNFVAYIDHMELSVSAEQYENIY